MILTILFFNGRCSLLPGLNPAGSAGGFANERLRTPAIFAMPDGGGLLPRRHGVAEDQGPRKVCVRPESGRVICTMELNVSP